MNTFHNYFETIKKNEFFLEILENEAPKLYIIVIGDIIFVNNYLHIKNHRGNILNTEEIDIFESGKILLENAIDEIKNIFEQTFESKVEKLNYYDDVLISNFLLNDMLNHIQNFESGNALHDNNKNGTTVAEEREPELFRLMRVIESCVAKTLPIPETLNDEIALYFNEFEKKYPVFVSVNEIYGLIIERISLTDDDYEELSVGEFLNIIE